MTGSRLGDESTRAGLQNERTALAWNRTGLALLGLAAVVIRLWSARTGPLAIVTIMVCGLLAAGVLIGGIGRYRAARDPSRGHAAIDARLPSAVVALIVVLAAVELVGIIR